MCVVSPFAPARDGEEAFGHVERGRMIISWIAETTGNTLSLSPKRAEQMQAAESVRSAHDFAEMAPFGVGDRWTR